jgi:HflK protein
MVEVLVTFIRETWSIFKEASLFILFGFAVAGILNAFLSPALVFKHLGRKGFKSIFLASLFGIPLPLCSCSTLPTALALRRKGAGKGATLSFLISTPETSIDSIAITYGLMDLTMTIFRPFAALITALTAGVATEHFVPEEERSVGATGVAADQSPEEEWEKRKNVKAGFHYAFVNLFDEISYWLVFGLILSGLLGALLPPDFVTKYLGSGLLPMLLMLVIGIPLYICATASTPIAAALILKGLSPGAALVFLLVGPATNIASLGVLTKEFGKKVVAMYLASIALVSLILGGFVNLIYALGGVDPVTTMGKATELIPDFIKIVSLAGFLFLAYVSFKRQKAPKEFVVINSLIEKLLGFKFNLKLGVKVVAALLAIAFLSTMFFTVEPGEVGMVERFGKVVTAELPPGLHLKFPYPIDVARKVRLDRVRTINLGFRTVRADTALGEVTTGVASPRGGRVEAESFFITGDENIVDINYVVHYRVKDPLDFLYKVYDCSTLVKDQAISTLIDFVAEEPIDILLTLGRAQTEILAAENLQSRLDGLRSGVEIITFKLLDVHAPQHVHYAFRDVASATEDKSTKINQGEIYYQETVKLARGDSARLIEEAEAFKVRKVKVATGEAESFLALNRQYLRAPWITERRLYLETMESVLPEVKKYIKPGRGTPGNLDLWILEGGKLSDIVGSPSGGKKASEKEGSRPSPPKEGFEF